MLGPYGRLKKLKHLKFICFTWTFNFILLHVLLLQSKFINYVILITS